MGMRLLPKHFYSPVPDYAQLRANGEPSTVRFCGLSPIGLFLSKCLQMALRRWNGAGNWLMRTSVVVKIPVTNTRDESSAALIRHLAGEGVRLNVTAMVVLYFENPEDLCDARKGFPSCEPGRSLHRPAEAAQEDVWPASFRFGQGVSRKFRLSGP
jgi:hypothetical protein